VTTGKGKVPLEDLGIHKKIKLKWILAKQGVRFLNGFNYLTVRWILALVNMIICSRLHKRSKIS
jgi:hypothetical protein